MKNRSISSHFTKRIGSQTFFLKQAIQATKFEIFKEESVREKFEFLLRKL